MAQTAKVSARIALTEGVTGDLGSGSASFDLEFLASLAAGTGNGQIAKSYQDSFNIAASGSATIDLAGGAADPVTAAVQTFTKVKGIFVTADAANVNDIVVGNGTNPIVGGPFAADGTGSVLVKAGGAFLWYDPVGLAVTATTGDILKLANSSSGTAVNGKILIIGH